MGLGPGSTTRRTLETSWGSEVVESAVCCHDERAADALVLRDPGTVNALVVNQDRLPAGLQWITGGLWVLWSSNDEMMLACVVFPVWECSKEIEKSNPTKIHQSTVIIVMYFVFDRFGGYYGVLFGFMTCGKPVSPTINHHEKHVLGMVCDWVNLCLPHIFDLDWWFLLFTWFLKNETCGLIFQKGASCWRHGQKHGVLSRKVAHPNIVKMPIGESLLKFIEIPWYPKLIPNMSSPRSGPLF